MTSPCHARSPSHIRVVLGVAALCCAACGADPTSAHAPPPSTAQPTLEIVDAPVATAVLDALDTTIDPCVDFYAWACDGWRGGLTDAGDLASRQTLVFSALEREREARLGALLDDLARAAPTDDAELALLGRFYGACLDVEAIDARGATPLQPWLARAAAVRSIDDALALAGELDAVDATALFGSWVVPDPGDSTRAVLTVTLDGLGMPDPGLYWARGERADALRQAYTDHVAALLELAGSSPESARIDAERAVGLERSLARAMVRAEELTPVAVELGVLESRTGLRWSAWLEGLGITLSPTTVVAAPPTALLAELAAVLDDAEVDTLRAWLSARVVVAMAPHLSAPFREAHDAITARWYGQAAERSRAQVCAELAGWALEPAVSRAWRQAYPAGDNARAASEVASAVRDELVDRTSRARWLDVSTRAVALGRLEDAVFDVGVGEGARDYAALDTRGAEGWLELYSAVLAHEARVYLDLVVDGVAPGVLGELWSSAPPTSTHVEWQPAKARLEVGAGALGAPLIDAAQAPATRFGGFGALVGRSMARVVDPATLPMASESVVDGFETQAACFEVQLGRFADPSGQPLDGRRLRAAAMADAAGLDLAWSAYQRWREAAPTVATVGSLDDTRLFFASFAQVWCTEQSAQQATWRAENLGEPPPQVRVNAAVGNVEAFHEAFACGGDAPMRNPLACQPW